MNKLLRILGLTLLTTTLGGAATVTLSDVATATDPSGKIADIANVMMQANEIIEDIPFIEANQPTSNVSSVLMGLPAGTYRLLNYGVPNEKATRKQVTDGMGMLESFSEIDKDLATLNGNSAAWREAEEKPFMEGLAQTFAQTLMYGASSEAEKFVGLAARTNETPQDTDDQLATYNIIDAGGTGSDNTSIFLIVWGQNTVHGIYPKGSKAGLHADDLGIQTVLDDNGNKFRAYQTHYKWDAGLVVRNWKYLVRIANIDVSDLSTDATTGVNLIMKMIEATERIPNLSAGKACFYMNRKVRTFLRQQIVNKSNVNLTIDTVAGKEALKFDGIPCRRVDQILNTEARVV